MGNIGITSFDGIRADLDWMNFGDLLGRALRLQDPIRRVSFMPREIFTVSLS